MIIKNSLILFTSLLLSISTSFADDLNIENSTINRGDDEAKIKFQIVKSASESQSILLYVQDSKCKSSAKKFFELTNTLGDAVARLYVEKLGESDTKVHHGQCSEAFLSNSSIDQRIADYQKVIKELRASATWWDKKLYIVGVAEGGLIAGLIAANTAETSKLAIISFGGGMTMAEAWIASLAKRMLADGTSSADIEKMQTNAGDFFENDVAESTSDSELANNTTFKWWASVVNVRLSETLAKIDFPIYIAHGTDDDKIPVESAQQVSDLFSTLGKDNLVYNEYTGKINKVSHCKTSSTNKPVFIEAVNWLVN